MSAVDAAHIEEPELESPEVQDAWDRAERVAARRARLARKALVYAGIVLVVSAVAGRAGLVVGLVLGLVLLRRAFREFVEPQLRRRWIEREVERQLERRMADQRRSITDAHEREVSQLAAGVAREIRDPVQAAKGLVRRMGEDPLSGENVDHARLALDELGRVERSISHLLRFAREPALRFEEMDLRESVEAARAELGEAVDPAGVHLSVHFDGPLLLWGDREKLRLVVRSLLARAIQAAAAVEEPRVEVAGGLDLAGSEVWLRVRDNGPGIAPERLARIWSPFESTEQPGDGVGLAAARKIVEGHGGSVDAHCGAAGGSELLMVLPRRAEAGASS